MWFKESLSELSNYTKFPYVHNISKTLENVPHYASNIAQRMIDRKNEDSQIVLKDADNYYIAHNTLNDMIYMNMKNVLMIDIDLQDINILEKFKECDEIFEVYKTRSGYHAFCVSKTFDHKDIDSYAEMVYSLNSDYFYIVFCYVKGWCVRLNLKDNEKGASIYEYVGRFGGVSQKHAIEECADIVNLHIEMSKLYIKDKSMKPRIIIDEYHKYDD